MDLDKAKTQRTKEILLLLKAFDDECKEAIHKIELTYQEELEEDNWNLADNVCGQYQNVFRTSNIKTFIQKIKEDISDEYKPQGIVDKVSKIIDQRAGDL